MLVEICVDSLTSVKAASDGGADRVELCSALKLGGLTPSSGLLRSVKSKPNGVCVYCMIRCRGGDFVYDEDEMQTMLDDVDILKANGADGFVFGALKPDGELDVAKCKLVVEECDPLPVTLHRAFDHSSQWKHAVDDAVACGFTAILTSGQRATALEGVETLRQILDYANDRILIMAGCGVNLVTLPAIRSALPRLRAVHSSASIKKESLCAFRPPFAMGSDDSFDTEKVTSASIVANIVALANAS